MGGANFFLNVLGDESIKKEIQLYTIHHKYGGW